MTNSIPRRMTNRRVIAILSLVAATAVFWRSSWVTGDPMWLDELHSAWTIDGGLGEVPSRAAAGNQSPLYFQIAWFLHQTSFPKQIALRAISAITGGLVILLAGWSVWQMTGRLAAVMATVAASTFSGSQLFYATEGRPYELLCLAGLIHALLFVRWIGSFPQCELSDRRRLEYRMALVGVAGTLVHPLAVILYGCELVILLVWYFARRPAAAPRFFIATFWIFFLPVIVAFVMLVIGFQHTAAHRKLWVSIVSTELTLTEASRAMFLPGTILVVSFLVSRIPGKLKRPGITDHGKEAGRTIRISGLLFVMTSLAVCLATWIGLAPLALPRYCMSAAAIPFVLTGLVVGQIQSAVWRRLTTTFIVAALFLLPLPVRIFQPHLSTLSGCGWDGNVFSFAIGNLRNEYWKEAWNSVGTGSVFLLANLLEDSMLDPEMKMDVPRKDYFLFPTIASEDPGLSIRCKPVRTVFRPRFSNDNVEIPGFHSDDTGLSRPRKGAVWWLVVRGLEATVNDAEQELISLIRGNASEESSITAIRSCFGDLTVVRIELQ